MSRGRRYCALLLLRRPDFGVLPVYCMLAFLLHLCSVWPTGRRSYVITQLTQGAQYEIEVEAAAKYAGPAASWAEDAPASAKGATTLDLSQLHTAGDETRRSIGSMSLGSFAASQAQSIVGIFSERSGAEVRRGASDADTEEWERTIDDLSRQARWDREAEEEAITARLSQPPSALSSRACPSSLSGAATARAQTSAHASAQGAKTERHLSPPRLVLPAAHGDKVSSPPPTGKRLVMHNLSARSWTGSELARCTHGGVQPHDIARCATAGWTGAHVQMSLDRYSSVLRDRRKAHVIDMALPHYCGQRVVSKQVQVCALRRPRSRVAATCPPPACLRKPCSTCRLIRVCKRWAASGVDARPCHGDDGPCSRFAAADSPCNMSCVMYTHRPVGRPHIYFTCACGVEVPAEMEDAMQLEPAPGLQRFCTNTLAVWWFR